MYTVIDTLLKMAIYYTKFIFILFLQILLPLSTNSKTYTTLNKGESLSSPGDVLVSPSNIFTAGFFAVGDNAYTFAVWFSDGKPTPVWMANRNEPVNGRNTKLSLLNSGNLVLDDAGLRLVWTSNTQTTAAKLQLHDNGDLVLRDSVRETVMWRSFESPTNTLLPEQPLSRNTKLTSSRSETNHSSGFYELYFDNDNVLRLLYDGGEVTSVYWPPSWMTILSAGRSSYNTSKTAVLNSYGRFSSSDNFNFVTSDFGVGPRRRLTLDPDGLFRVYSFNEAKKSWGVSWQLQKWPCSIHGLCGANSVCNYRHDLGRSCTCLPGYKSKNPGDWSEGCVPESDTADPCKNNGSDANTNTFLKISHAEFYGFDIGNFPNHTLEECKSLCLSYCNCKGFAFQFEWATGFYSCYPKFLLFNGYLLSGFDHWTYIKSPTGTASVPLESTSLQCTDSVVEVERAYTRPNKYPWLKSLLWCVGAVGVVEVACVLFFLCKTHESSSKLREQRFMQLATGFRKFEYSELKRASRNFSQEIGRGGSGRVYKGVLSDNRVAAIKCLNEAFVGEAEFLAEVGLIGRLNHANLLETWGYCTEGKHRMLVYEYMENGSLADILRSDKLDSRHKFEIALGTAKGLSYLHEECLEWVLHCDIKPHNILLDDNYQPKVADFGLSKRVNRSGVRDTNVSAIRGTRGYMAPEWVYNLPITAKVDVYSYGIVVLEMVTGKSPIEMSFNGDENCVDIEEEEDDDSVKNLMRVALQCAQENRDARPTMKQVVDMLLGNN